MNFGEVHRLNQGKRCYDKSATTDSSITLTRTYQPSRSAFSFHDPGSDEYSMKRSAMEIVLFAVLVAMARSEHFAFLNRHGS